MKTFVRPIEVITYSDIKGQIKPIRFRVKFFKGENPQVIKIDKIFSQEKDKLAGNDMILYRCQGKIDGIDKVFEIKYELETCKWILFRI